MGFINNLGMFLLGIRDSLSLGWIQKLIFCKDPVTKDLLPAARALRKTLTEALIRIGLTIFIIPFILSFLGIDLIAFLFRWIYLILGFGYIFFYNEDIMSSTRKIINFRKKEMKEIHFQLDKIQKIDTYFYLSGVIKGVIFLILFYLVTVSTLNYILSFIPYLGILITLVSQAFFYAAFLFLTAWPFDNYNAAFLEKQKYYLVGFGMLLSIICSHYITSLAISNAVSMIISLWMLINTVLFGPVTRQDGKQFQSFAEIWTVLTNSHIRSSLKNQYNTHRQKLKKDKKYGQQIVKSIILVKPALLMTDFVNGLIGKLFFNQSRQQIPNQQA